MRILLWEGDLYLNENVAEYLKFVGVDEILSAYNMYDMLYYIFDTDTEFDVIIIGDEIEDIQPEGLEKEIETQLDKLPGDYFPVTLIDVCKNLCKEKGKKEPEIIIYTTFYYYPFKESRSYTTEEAKSFIKSKNIKYVDKTENIDTLKTLAEMLKEISNK